VAAQHRGRRGAPHRERAAQRHQVTVLTTHGRATTRTGSPRSFRSAGGVGLRVRQAGLAHLRWPGPLVAVPGPVDSSKVVRSSARRLRVTRGGGRLRGRPHKRPERTLEGAVRWCSSSTTSARHLERLHDTGNALRRLLLTSNGGRCAAPSRGLPEAALRRSRRDKRRLGACATGREWKPSPRAWRQFFRPEPFPGCGHLVFSSSMDWYPNGGGIIASSRRMAGDPSPRSGRHLPPSRHRPRPPAPAASGGGRGAR
jgi:hypothetical protein